MGQDFDERFESITDVRSADRVLAAEGRAA
jgi:hypothetical protein